VALDVGTLFFFLYNLIVVLLSAQLALAGVGLGYYPKLRSERVGGNGAKK
jgi:hypothetical protein